jgi:tetratricopeptide (TPR) repeat protein
MNRFGLSLACLLLSLPALAVGPEVTSLDDDPDWRDAHAHLARGDYRAALPLLHRVRTANPASAEAAAQVGFAYRKLGQMEASKRFYDAALTLDRFYLPAISYQGQWFLETGDIASARVNLQFLASLCGTCRPWADLDGAIRAREGR